VGGAHAFTNSGTYTVNISVTGLNSLPASTSTSVVVRPQPLTIEPNAVSGSPGTAINAVVANFVDPNTADVTSDFTAVINWGDGHSSTGTVNCEDGNFSVTAGNTYSSPGPFAVGVTVVRLNGLTGLTASTTAQAVITAPATSSPSFTLSATTIKAIPGQPLTNAEVATFTDTNPSDTMDDFKALIGWGDGHSSTGTVLGGNGSFIVTSSNTYTSPGTYPVNVTVLDQYGNSLSVTGTANVTQTPVFTAALAPFSDTSPTHAGGFTNTNRPTFSGTAPPYALAQLIARPINIDAIIPVGQTAASGAGQWTLSTGPLADGIYCVTGVVTPAVGYSGPPLPIANNGQLVVDTTSPRVVAVTPIGGTSQVLATLHAGQSELNILRLLSPLNYLFYGPRASSVHPSSVALVPSGV
jgi:hypothetical protein